MLPHPTLKTETMESIKLKTIIRHNKNLLNPKQLKTTVKPNLTL